MRIRTTISRRSTVHPADVEVYFDPFASGPVVLRVQTINAFDGRENYGVLTMSPGEARALADRLNDSAAKAILAATTKGTEP